MCWQYPFIRNFLHCTCVEEQLNINVRGGGDITYPTVLADRLIEHTWSDTSSSARCHLNMRINVWEKWGGGGEWFFLPSGSLGCLRLCLFFAFSNAFFMILWKIGKNVVTFFFFLNMGKNSQREWFKNFRQNFQVFHWTLFWQFVTENEECGRLFVSLQGDPKFAGRNFVLALYYQLKYWRRKTH